VDAARVLPLLPEQLDADQRALRASILAGPRGAGPQAFPLAGADGTLEGPFGIFLHAPGVGGALSALGEGPRFAGTLDARCREIAVLTVAAACASEFEWYAHSRLARGVGLSGPEIDAVGAGRPCSDDPRELLVQDAARRLVVRERPDGDLADRVLAGSAQLGRWSSWPWWATTARSLAPGGLRRRPARAGPGHAEPPGGTSR